MLRKVGLPLSLVAPWLLWFLILVPTKFAFVHLVPSALLHTVCIRPGALWHSLECYAALPKFCAALFRALRWDCPTIFCELYKISLLYSGEDLTRLYFVPTSFTSSSSTWQNSKFLNSLPGREPFCRAQDCVTILYFGAALRYATPRGIGATLALR